MAEYSWLIQYGAGIILGYYVISPRLRGFINRIITGLFRFFFPFKERVIPKPSSRYIRVDRKRYIKPKTFPKTVVPSVKIDTKPIELGQGGILVGEDEINNWLNNNPDLRKLNSIGGKE